MTHELEGADALAQRMIDRARGAGVLLIWRAQSRSVRQMTLRRGRTESSTLVTSVGHGVQIATDEGHSAMASRDDLAPEPAVALLDRTIELARRGPALGVSPGVATLPEPVCDRRIPVTGQAFASIRSEPLERRLREIEAELSGAFPDVEMRVSYRTELDAWRIVRDDGTDVLFAMPRCTIGLRATAGTDGSRHGVSAVSFSPDPTFIWQDEPIALFRQRAHQAAELATRLPDAPAHPSGSFPLVIDFALAKGLAHEAFGHAAEADGFRSSVLARDGKFRCGDAVGATHVSIIDEPLQDDHAWQPYSANGVLRAASVIVDHGRLKDGLSDIWSSESGGIPLTGAARAESFHYPPQPRMTNIRIEVDDPLPAPGRFEDYGPQRVQQLLDEAGVFRRHPEVRYLSGYSGGQVNPTTGDFVFNCRAIYTLGVHGVRLHKPAIFSGSMFGALRSVREAFGPLRLDALGYCGKWGQSVSSSGGSHFFLVLEPDSAVRLGGRPAS